MAVCGGSVMTGDPYCGKCHTWMWPSHRSKMLGFDQDIVWVCGCPPGKPDMSKDPNCHNSNHEHHDPQSPIVKSMKTIRRAEDIADGFIKVEEGECTCGLDAYKAPEQHSSACPVWAAAFEERTVADSQPVFKGPDLDDPVQQEDVEAMPTGVYSAADGGPDNEGTICGHERLDGRCNFWGCPVRRAKAAEHVVHNGSPCEECGALITDEPEKGFVARDGPTDRPGSPFADHPYHVAVLDSATGEMLGWRPLREPKIDEETRAELDAILEEANEKVED
ncbi:hypothetical protein LCGC14_0644110 [marine sediment metagenome]|uniref:Uncharacterized protein n=1 Tax=marine sediment metagenome TaxID=412755 RepID=A0A0F9RHW3_9ZZZZ